MFSSRVDKRIDSFGRKGSKNGTKSWPFTNQQAKKKLLDAEYLAKLGFHFNNTTKDHVVCHFCDLECDWSSDFPHPLSFHLSNQPCSFALAWGVALIRNNQVSSVLNLHQHEQVLKDLDYQSLLLETFQDWPYNRDKKGQKTPSAQQVILTPPLKEECVLGESSDSLIFIVTIDVNCWILLSAHD